MSDSFGLPEDSLPPGKELQKANEVIERHGMSSPNITVSERMMKDLRKHMEYPAVRDIHAYTKWEFVHKDGSDDDDDRDMVSLEELSKRDGKATSGKDSVSYPWIGDFKTDGSTPDIDALKATMDRDLLTVYVNTGAYADADTTDDGFKVHVAETGWMVAEYVVDSDRAHGELSGAIDVEHVDGGAITIDLDDVPISALFRCGGKLTYDVFTDTIIECKVDDPEEHESDSDTDDVSGAPVIPEPDVLTIVDDDTDKLCPECRKPVTASAFDETVDSFDDDGSIYAWLDRVDHACRSDLHDAFYLHEVDVGSSDDADADDSLISKRLSATVGRTADESTIRELSQTERANVLVTFAARLEITRLQIGDIHIYQTGGDDGVTYVAKTNSGDELVRRKDAYSAPVEDDGDGIVELLIAHMDADGHSWADAYDSLKD